MFMVITIPSTCVAPRTRWATAGAQSLAITLAPGRRAAPRHIDNLLKTLVGREDSNLQPDRYERSALTIELRARRVPSINARWPMRNASLSCRLTVALGCDPVFAGAPWSCTSSA